MTEFIRLDCKMCGLKMYDTSINEVWGVLGDPDDDEGDMPHLWRTEKDARIYAKRMYPEDSAMQIADRIYQAFVSAKQISLFVVDPDTDSYFKSKCIKLHSLLPIVQHITNATDI
jgi:hypothetical protein